MKRFSCLLILIFLTSCAHLDYRAEYMPYSCEFLYHEHTHLQSELVRERAARTNIDTVGAIAGIIGSVSGKRDRYDAPSTSRERGVDNRINEIEHRLSDIRYVALTKGCRGVR